MTKVLYIEHDDDNLYMLKMRLERVGDFEVLASNDSEQGCKLALTERPDVILMDLEMPLVDRWEPVRTLKNDPHTCDIPIIGLSAYVLDSERETAIATGCDEFDVKPISFEVSGRHHSARCCEPEITHSLRWSGRRAARQAHCKNRAFARLARHCHVAAHHAGELAGDRKAESSAAESLRGRGIGLRELLKQLCLLLGRHADASIGDGQLDPVAAVPDPACPQLDLAVLGELAGIA